MIKQIRGVRAAARLTVALLFLVITGCGARQENLSLLPADDLYALGLEAFESGDNDRAITYLEFFVAQHLGDPRAPDARMMLGYANMREEDYLPATTHFQRMLNDFSSHPRALEARFQICEAYYQLSPRTPLDQEYTRSAILYCESVVEYYPDSEEAERATAYVDELREKLAKKVFDNGAFYFSRRAYDSAVVYFEQVLDQFPESAVAPSALEQLAETYSRLGYVEDAEAARERLLREYPQSPEAQALRT